MSSRIWIISELYYPEDTSTGHYLTGIAEGLARNFDVCVITGQPTYSRRGERCPRQEYRCNVRIERCATTTWDKNILPLRAVNMLSLAGSVLARALNRLSKGDVVLVGTNPPLLPWVTLAACRAKGARCIIKVDDVYPEAAIAAGLVAPQSTIARSMAMAARSLYRRADGIIALGRCMADLIRRKAEERELPIAVIPNFADTDDVRPASSSANALRAQLGLQEKFVVLLVGNLGRVQGLEMLLDGARFLRGEPDIHFLIVGSGAREAWLKTEIRQFGLTNITLVGPKPRSEQTTFLTAGDIALITLAKGMVGAGVPSRIYNFMAAGIPIISATGHGSETNLVVTEEDIGWAIEPGNANALATVVRNAKQSNHGLRQMGSRARRAAETRYTCEHIVEAYSRAIKNIISGDRVDD